MSTIEHTTISSLDRIPLGRRIGEMLAEKGDAYSIRAFAGRIGMNREFLRQMILGARRIAPSEIERIATGFGITVERLKQIDTHTHERELTSLLKGNKLTKVMLMRAHDLANHLVVVARGATERGFSLNNLGRVHYLQKNYDDAHECWLSALDYAKQLQEEYDNKHLLHLVTANLMLTYSIRKEYSNIEDVLKLVEEAFSDDPDTKGMMIYTRMKMQEERGNIVEAKEYAYRSLEHFEQTNHNGQIGNALINVAHYEYMLGNYTTSERVLSSAINTLQSFEDMLILAVKEYVKTLMQLRDYQKVIEVVEEYNLIAKDYQDNWGKLQIMYSVAKNNPSFAENISNDASLSANVRYYACKCLFEFFYIKDDSESAIRYYKKGLAIYGSKSEYLNEEGF